MAVLAHSKEKRVPAAAGGAGLPGPVGAAARAVEVKAAIHSNLALPEETASRFGRRPYRRSHRLDPAAEAAGAVTRPPVPVAAFMVWAGGGAHVLLSPGGVSRGKP